MKRYLYLASFIILTGCTSAAQKYAVIGKIIKLDPSLDSIISPDAKIEVIAEGMDWSEGPLWIEKEKMLLFSDVPRDTVFKWTEAKGKEVYLTPSGYTDTVKRGGEMGSNGLTLDIDGKLILCQCGNRQIARMETPVGMPSPKYSTVANNYNGKKFNSPNDVVVSSKGDTYFTDPPYGLEKNMADPKKEIPFQGVYMVSRDMQVTLLTDTITRPNGIVLMNNEKTLLIANSDPAKPYWYAFDLADGKLTNGRIFHKAVSEKGEKGLPDGMKVDKAGNLFASGPGGIWVFNKAGKLAGKIRVPEATSNCALSGDEKTLYITNDMNILRVKLRN